MTKQELMNLDQERQRLLKELDECDAAMDELMTKQELLESYRLEVLNQFDKVDRQMYIHGFLLGAVENTEEEGK